MPTQRAEAEWKGNLADGSGRLKVGSGAFDGPYSLKSRFEDGQSATNPEELIGAAHAGCFTMALTAQLARAKITPTHIHTEARVKLEKVGEGFSITTIELETEADIPGIDVIVCLQDPNRFSPFVQLPRPAARHHDLCPIAASVDQFPLPATRAIEIRVDLFQRCREDRLRKVMRNPPDRFVLCPSVEFLGAVIPEGDDVVVVAHEDSVVCEV